MFRGNNLLKKHAFIERYFLSKTGKATKLCSIEHKNSQSKGLGFFANKAYFSIKSHTTVNVLDLSIHATTKQQSKTDSVTALDINKSDFFFFDSKSSNLIVANLSSQTNDSDIIIFSNKKHSISGLQEEDVEVDTGEVQTSSSTSSTSPTPADTPTHNSLLLPAAPSLFVLAGLGSLYLGYRGWKSFPKHSWKGLSYAAIPLLVGLGMERGLSTPSKKLLGISLLAIADLGLILRYSRSWHQRIDMLVALATATVAMGGFATYSRH